MWQDYSSHHIQRGDVTAVVWGAPGALPGVEKNYPEDGACLSRSSSPKPPGAGAAGTEPGGLMIDAEALTRGRRADTPFVQQCDLIFPLPERDGGDGGDGGGDVVEDQEQAERRVQKLVRRSLGEVFYYRARGPLSALLKEPFLSSCVLQESFSALALNAPSDQGNSFAILPGGVLVLSLDRESFQTMGLPGKAAPMRPKGKGKRAGAGAGSTGGSQGVQGGGAGGSDRYISAFDLSSKAFRPGKPLHDRVISCLDAAGKSLGSPDDDKESVAVDMVVCWWGSAEAGDGRSGREEDVGGKVGYEARSGKRSEVSGQKSGARRDKASPAEGSDQGRGSECVEGRRNGRQQQRHRDHPRQCCREISFPPGFSSKRIDITPDFRFFREACCPDLDFVGQGNATMASTKTPPACEDGGGGKGGSMRRCEDTTSSGRLGANGTARNNGDLVGMADGACPGDRTAEDLDASAALVSTPPRTTKSRLILDMFEWLGAVSCGLGAVISRNPSPPDPYLSEFETPRHLCYRRNRVLCRARLRGFLPPIAVARFVQASGAAASGTLAATARSVVAQEQALVSPSSSSSVSSSLPTHGVRQQQADGCAWGAVTAWPFRDAPRAYAGAEDPCAGGHRSKRNGHKSRRGKGGGGHEQGQSRKVERSATEWPVGGHGVYTVVACPGETAVAYVSARCPGPGW